MINRAAPIKRKFKPKMTAHTGRAREAYCSAHRLDQPLADGQAEPAAAVAPGHRVVGLYKGLKELGLLLGSNPGTRVPHVETDSHPAILLMLMGDANDHPAVMRKLQAVTDKIDQHLREAGWVAFQRRRESGALEPEVESALHGLGHHQGS